jgi:hypothetical protein
MQYTDGIGINITKPELVALVQFCGETDRLANVSFRVRDGRIVAWATDGHNIANLHGDAWDGKGKASTADHDWQIGADMAKRLAKQLQKGEDLTFRVNKSLQLTTAETKDIEDGTSISHTDLKGHTSEQLDLDLPNYFPSRPMRDTGEVPAETVSFAWPSLALLKRVCSAAGTGAIRVFVNSNPLHPIYCEVATPAQLNDDEQPRWVCVLAPSITAEIEGHEVDDDADPAGGDD